MLVNCSLSPVTPKEWEQEQARVSKLQELIPNGEVPSVSLDELKTLGGNAIVLTCPLENEDTALTNTSVESVCKNKRQSRKTVMLPRIHEMGKTTFQELIFCPGTIRAEWGLAERIRIALTYGLPTHDTWLSSWGAWT